MPRDPREADAADPVAVPSEEEAGAGGRKRGVLFAAPFVAVYLGFVVWSLVTGTAFYTVLLLAPGVAVFTAAVYLLGRGPEDG